VLLCSSSTELAVQQMKNLTENLAWEEPRYFCRDEGKNAIHRFYETTFELDFVVIVAVILLYYASKTVKFLLTGVV